MPTSEATPGPGFAAAERILKSASSIRVEHSRRQCRTSLYEFVRQAWPVLEPAAVLTEGRLLRTICDLLQQVSDGKIKRLLINVPPGCTKSMLVNVLWPAWEWGPRGEPSLRYISASYEQGLAVRDMVKCRDLIKSEWYQARWPIEMKEDQDQKTYYANTATGWRFAASVRGALTGYRGDRILIDDPHSVKTAESEAEREESLRWFTETLPTRLNKADESVMVVIMQRLHERDVSGLILKELKDEWTCVVLPMEFEPERACRPWDWREKDGDLLWPERFSRGAVDALKKTLSSRGGTYAVAGQLQQRPVPRGGGMFPSRYAQYMDLPEKFGRRVRGWDLAATKDGGAATVGLKLCITPDGRLIIEDVRRLQGSPREVEQAILSCARADGPSVAISLPQDPGQAGKSQKSALAKLLHGYIVHFSPESGDKADRARPIAAQWESSNVWMVRGVWNDRFTGELEIFPNGEYLDQGDALSRSYGYLLMQVVEDLGTLSGSCYSDDDI